MRLGLLPLLMLVVLLSPMAIDIYLPSMPIMAKEFGVSSSAIQSTLALFLFAMGIGQIVIGPLADKFGRRPVLMCGILLYIASSLLAVWAEVFSVLQVARVLQGFAACAASIVVFSAVRDCYSSQQSPNIYSYLNGAICVVPALAPTIGGLLALAFGWRSNFILMAVYALVILALVQWRFAETRPENTVTQGALYRWARYQPILTHSQFLFYAFSCMSGMAVILCYVSYSPVWLIEHLGVNELTFTALFGINAGLNILACVLAPMVIRRLGKRNTVIAAQILILLAGGLELVIYSGWQASGLVAAIQFMLPMLLLCVGFALLLGPATSMALASFGDRAGTASAMLGCIQMSGASVITLLVQQTPFVAPLAVGGLSVVLAGVFLIIMQLKCFTHWHGEVVTSH